MEEIDRGLLKKHGSSTLVQAIEGLEDKENEEANQQLNAELRADATMEKQGLKSDFVPSIPVDPTSPAEKAQQEAKE